jgi:hypothetical protein
MGKEGIEMNLDLVEKLLSEAATQPDGTLEVKGPEAARETRFIGAIGLAEILLPEGEDVIAPTRAIIKRVTAAGRKFLNVFNDEPGPMHHSGLTVPANH